MRTKVYSCRHGQISEVCHISTSLLSSILCKINWILFTCWCSFLLFAVSCTDPAAPGYLGFSRDSESQPLSRIGLVISANAGVQVSPALGLFGLVSLLSLVSMCL